MAETFFYNHPSDRVTGTPSVETGAAATGYEATYLTNFSDLYLQRPAKLTTPAGAWLIDDGAAQRVDLVMIWHNYMAGLSGVKFEMNATNSWGAPSLSHTFTVGAKRPDGSTVKLFKDLRGVSGYTDVGFRYSRHVVTGTNDVNIGAKVWRGSIIRQLSVDVAWGVVRTDKRPGIVLTTDFGHVWTYDLAVNTRMQVGQLSSITDDDREAVRDWHDACGGAAKLTLVIPEPADADQGAWLVHWIPNGSDGLVSSDLDATWSFRDATQMRLAFQEVTAGGPEWT